MSNKKYLPGTNPAWGRELPDGYDNSLVDKNGNNWDNGYNFDERDDEIDDDKTTYDNLIDEVPFNKEDAEKARSVVSEGQKNTTESSPDTKELHEMVSSTDITVYEVLNPTNSDEAKKEFLDNSDLISPHFVYGNLNEEKIASNLATIDAIYQQISAPSDLLDSKKRLINVLVDDVAKKNNFVQSCINYRKATSPEEKIRAAEAQKATNEALYGAPDETTFYSLLSSELAKIKPDQLSPDDKEIYDSLISEIGEIKSTTKERFIPKPETVKRFSKKIDLLFNKFWKHIPEGKDSFTTKEACDITNEIIQDEFPEDSTAYHAVMSDTAKSVSVNHLNREIVFPVNRSSGDFSRLGLKKILVHELCTHAYRALVYEDYPVHAFSHEFPGNEEIDEGIAKCCEQAVAGKYSDSGIEHYINIGLANFKNKNFREIFEIQQKLLYLKSCKPDESAEEKAARFHAKDNVIFTRTTRCFRGTGELPNNKDLVYYNGANRVWQYIEENIDNPYLLENLFLSGKTDIFNKDQRGLIYDAKTGSIT